jgi:hypothetical protein
MNAPRLGTGAAQESVAASEISPNTKPRQAVVIRCAGCGRRPRAPQAVAGWRDDRLVALCARCAKAWRRVQGDRP